MLFCKSSTVKVGTIALICTASCVVATIASVCFVAFVHLQASGPRPDLQARPFLHSFFTLLCVTWSYRHSMSSVFRRLLPLIVATVDTFAQDVRHALRLMR